MGVTIIEIWKGRKYLKWNQTRVFFDANMTLPERACCDFQWWCTNIPKSYNGITKGTSSLIIKTDAYKRYWAKVYEGTGTVGQFSLYDLST